MIRYFTFIYLFFLSSLLVANPNLEKAFKSLLKDPIYENVELSVVLLDLTNKQILLNHQPSVKHTPASLVKVPLSAVLLDRLGEEFQFETKVYTQWFAKDDEQNLYVKASGDPNLQLAQFHALAQALYVNGGRSFKQLILDVNNISADDDLHPNRGIYYYATSSAFNLNYNHEYLRFDDEHCLRAFRQVPYLKINDEQLIVRPHASKALYPRLSLEQEEYGETIHVIGEASLKDEKALSLKARVANPDRYTAAHIESILAIYGIRFQHPTRFDSFSAWKYRKVHTMRSKPLKMYLRELNRNSNNMLASALVKQLCRPGQNYNLRSGVAAFNHYLYKDIGLKPSDFKCVDASGLSMTNYATASAFIDILSHVYDSDDYWVVRSTMSGKRLGRHLRLWYKTGTLGARGVSNSMGYIEDKKTGQSWAYVVMGKRKGPGDYVSKGYYAEPIIKMLRSELKTF